MGIGIQSLFLSCRRADGVFDFLRTRGIVLKPSDPYVDECVSLARDAMCEGYIVLMIESLDSVRKFKDVNSGAARNNQPLFRPLRVFRNLVD
jgi:hypothetical protein